MMNKWLRSHRRKKVWVRRIYEEGFDNMFCVILPSLVTHFSFTLYLKLTCVHNHQTRERGGGEGERMQPTAHTGVTTGNRIRTTLGRNALKVVGRKAI